jgi:molecular chaperone DnaK
MSVYYGIDFGTTNCATVGIDVAHVQRYGDNQGQPYPSIVAINKTTGEVKARGREARQHREQLAGSCEIITSVKTHLGTGKTWNIGGRTWTPEQIASEIFKGLKEQVQNISGGDGIDSALVSIPIGFNPAKRKELRQAATLAGIEIISFVSEPTAAVFKHYSEIYKWQRVAIFDWGGGTLDIAVVELSQGNILELSTGGKYLGGDDIDYKIANWAHQQILKATGSNVAFAEMSSNARDKMLVRAEEAKRELSSRNEVSINLLGYGGLDAPEIKIEAGKFVSLIEPELEIAVAYLKEVVKRSKISLDELGCILMVGGSSKLRGLADKISHAFDCEIIEPDINSDWHVAHGACLLNQTKGAYRVSQNIGLLLSDDTYFPLVQEGDMVQHTETIITFGQIEDSPNANFVFIESPDNSPNGIDRDRRTIGYLAVPSYGFLYEPIILSFQIDRDLLFTVTAKSQNMSDKEVKRWEFDEVRFSYNLPVGERI